MAVFASPASVAGPWRFAVTCDSRGTTGGINEPVLSELAHEIVRSGAEFFIYPGDLVYGARVPPALFESQLWDWVRAMRPLYDAGIPVYVCRGNHEVGDMWDAVPPQRPDPYDNYGIRWLRVFGDPGRPELLLPDKSPPGEEHMTYALIHENALIVGLDQYGGRNYWLAHSVDQTWLDAELERNTKPHVFVFGHEPAFRTYHWDCLDAHPAQRDAFWNSLSRAGGRTYFCGHDHYYDHAVVDDGDDDPGNDIHQLVVATAGAPFYEWSPPYLGDNGDFIPHQLYHIQRYGYILVDVDSLNVTLTWMQRRDNDMSLPGIYEVGEVWGYTVVPGPVVLSPNGGERVIVGRPFSIRWKMIDGADVKRVTLEYSVDDGLTWLFIDEVDNDRTYAWDVPKLDSATCLVRVSRAAPLSAVNPTGGGWATSDVSDAVFSIFECQAKLAADLNGDCYVDVADMALMASEWLKCGNPLDPACNPLE
ncbi:MAG: metallophosphoesterase [Sedimentisphaerales bacterium]|nr:metallophosphoesterase [Sedimentisphaerales bacterium]